MIRRMTLAVVLAAMVLAARATPALAQIVEEGVKSENIDELAMKRPVTEYVLAGVFLLAALGLGFMTSKRSHD